jgi:hypothetical protein
VPQRGVKGAAFGIWNYYLFIDVLLHKLPKIPIFNQVFQTPEVCREQKRLENTDLEATKILQIFLEIPPIILEMQSMSIASKIALQQ